MEAWSDPIVVLEPETEYLAARCFAVEINGPSRLVPASDTLNWCGVDHPNRVAIETEAEIVCYNLLD